MTDNHASHFDDDTIETLTNSDFNRRKFSHSDHSPGSSIYQSENISVLPSSVRDQNRKLFKQTSLDISKKKPTSDYYSYHINDVPKKFESSTRSDFDERKVYHGDRPENYTSRSKLIRQLTDNKDFSKLAQLHFGDRDYNNVKNSRYEGW